MKIQAPVIRIGKRLYMHLKNETLWVRQATREDCKSAWKWSNDPEVRKSSFSSEPISWRKHQAWFVLKLKNPKCLYWIVMLDNDVSIGQLRFNLRNQEASMSLSLGKIYRGKGYGTELIRMATQKIFDRYSIDRIHAYIKPDNISSIRAFKKAGFAKIGATIFQRHPALHFIIERNRL